VDWAVGIEYATATSAGFMSHLETFNQHRLLLVIAYRMLGTVTDAEDVVQKPSCAGSKQRKHGEIRQNLFVNHYAPALTICVQPVCSGTVRGTVARTDHDSTNR